MPKTGSAVLLPDTSAAPHERIITVARELFCRDGIHATGVDRILSTAGASKMTLYTRFGSKEALIRAALRQEGEDWRRDFAERVIAASDTPLGRLRAIIPALGEWFGGGRFYGCAFINAVAEHTKGDPGLRALTAEHHDACRKFLTGLVQDAGFAAPEDFARQLMLLIDGTVTTLMVSGDEGALHVAARTLETLLAAEARNAAPQPAAATG
ncbi:TetR/AcrR family transcriptional regulator [Roseomonas elaeocarpi]|uniref:TetR/AcrR family transcriptional regulator n=1 Tax=Roseomonas elaeocarpi TaxID=907779 RepID=A0ABV6JQR7_9PROT